MDAQRESMNARRRWHRDLASPAARSPVRIPDREKPEISVLLLAGDADADSVAKSVQAIARNSIEDEIELIVAKDGACFAQGINEAAALARGRYLHVVGRNVIVMHGCSHALRDALERSGAALACSQIRDAKGRVHSAGLSVAQDGELLAFGGGRPHTDSSLTYKRHIDASAPESFMISAECWRAAGGIDPRYRDARYGVADLCLRLRERGYAAVYEPESVAAVTGRRNESDAVDERKRFSERWSGRAAECSSKRRTVLVMDAFIPRADRDAGSKRLLAIIAQLLELGAHVVFVPDAGGAQEDAARELRRLGCEVRAHSGDAMDVLRGLTGRIDAAWLSRPQVCERYAGFVTERLGAPVVYDTVDLHHLRLEREESISGRRTDWRAMRDLEFALMRRARCTVVTSSEEYRLLETQGVHAHVVPVVADVCERAEARLVTRERVLFVGNFTHAPNLDALAVLAHEVMPRLRRELAHVVLDVAGFDPSRSAQRFANEYVRVLGHVANLDPLYASARVFAAPLRYGAGAKGKIVESFAHGVPVVTTPIGAEGLDLRDGGDCLVRSQPDEFTDAVLRLYRDDRLWARLSEGGSTCAARFSPQALRPALAAILDSLWNQPERAESTRPD